MNDVQYDPVHSELEGFWRCYSCLRHRHRSFDTSRFACWCSTIQARRVVPKGLHKTIERPRSKSFSARVLQTATHEPFFSAMGFFTFSGPASKNLQLLITKKKHPLIRRSKRYTSPGPKNWWFEIDLAMSRAFTTTRSWLLHAVYVPHEVPP